MPNLSCQLSVPAWLTAVLLPAVPAHAGFLPCGPGFPCAGGLWEEPGEPAILCSHVVAVAAAWFPRSLSALLSVVGEQDNPGHGCTSGRRLGPVLCPCSPKPDWAQAFLVPLPFPSRLGTASPVGIVNELC